LCVEIDTAWTIQLSKHSTYHQRKVFGERVETLVRNEAVRSEVRTIGPRAGKDHNNVLRDIKEHGRSALPQLWGKTESSTGGRPTKVFMLPKCETLVLLPGRQQLDRSLTTP